MFTGIVEQACAVLEFEERPGSVRLTLDLAPLLEVPAERDPPRARGAGRPLRLGDSVAINGVCLTIAALDGTRADFEAVPETLGQTNLGALAAGVRVNVERSLCFGDPLDGHLVQGHVERTGEVLAAEVQGDQLWLTVECGADFAGRCLHKGSVTVDGVSLTIAELGVERLSVALVPHTLERTNLGDRRAGERVNLEPDLIGQWVSATVRRVLDEQSAGQAGGQAGGGPAAQA